MRTRTHAVDAKQRPLSATSICVLVATAGCAEVLGIEILDAPAAMADSNGPAMATGAGDGGAADDTVGPARVLISTDGGLEVAACGERGHACCTGVAACKSVLTCSTAGLCVQCTSFRELAVVAGHENTFATGLSADGRVAVGYGDGPEAAVRALRWTLSATDSVVEPLGVLPGGFYSFAYGSNADGSVIVGWSDDERWDDGENAFRWTANTGMVDLGPGVAIAANSDATVIVGARPVTLESREAALRWDAVDKSEELGFLPGGSKSRARASSADGAVIVGEADLGIEPAGDAGPAAAAEPHRRAFRWMRGTGPIGLGTLPGGRFSWASDTSTDGAVVVGIGDSDDGLQVFRWTDAERRLVPLAPALDPYGPALSGNGAVVVGTSPLGPFIWRMFEQSQSLVELVKNHLPVGWRLNAATAVSDDASVIVGDGFEPGGKSRSWMITIGEECP